MHCKQGYALLNIVIIMSLTIVLSFGILDIYLASIKIEALNISNRDITVLTDSEIKFLSEFKEYIQSNSSLVEKIKNKNFENELSIPIKISSCPRMSARFCGELIEWQSYKNNTGNTIMRFLKYEVTHDDKFKIYISTRQE